VENPVAKLQRAKAMGGNPSDDLKEALRNAFAKASDSMLKMYEVMCGFRSVNTHSFLRVFNLKQDIERQLIQVGKDYEAQVQAKREIEDQVRYLNQVKQKKEAFRGFELTSTTKKWTLITTQVHNTLCSAPGCTSNCHISCGLPREMSTGAEAFKGCAAMTQDGTSCKVCSHNYTQHYHLCSEWKEETETVEYIDAALKQQFDEAGSREAQIALVLSQLQRRQQESKNKLFQLREQVKAGILQYEQLGLARSFKSLLVSQIEYVKELIQGNQHDAEVAGPLRVLENELKLMLKNVS